MRMTSTGKERRHPAKEIIHFTHTDKKGSWSQGDDGPYVRRWVEGDRKYRITLTPDDVINYLSDLPPDSIADAVISCLFDLPPDSIADAVSKRKEASNLPEVLKQLAKGAIRKKAK